MPEESQLKKLTDLVDKNIRYLIALFAISILFLRSFFPEWGKNIDTISLALIAVAILPWLSQFVKSFAVAGVFEAELTQVKDEVSQIREHQVSSSNQTIKMQSGPPVIESIVEKEVVGSQASNIVAIEKLAQEYISTRKSMASGSVRTERMTQIFTQMMAESKTVRPTESEVIALLRSEDQGKALAGTAAAFAEAQASYFEPLVTCIESSNQPFVQYWALRALKETLDSFGKEILSPSIIVRLKALEKGFQRGTDRAYLLLSINSALRD